jgi:NADH-quinone oxidoreductase subunit E/NADP-reducing hydrogenase subunit HndA
MTTTVPVNDDRLVQLKNFIASVKDTKQYPDSYLIAILHKAQALYGHLDKAVMDEISVAMNIPTAHIWGVATFYHYFNLTPKGKHTIAVCLGTACYVKGADQIVDTLREELRVNFGGTTDDKLFTLNEARCLGACGLAPVIMIDDKIYGELTPQKVRDIIASYRNQAKGN